MERERERGVDGGRGGMWGREKMKATAYVHVYKREQERSCGCVWVLA